MVKLLIFGGTSDGRILAEQLVKQGRHVTISVATQYGGALLPNGWPGLSVHIGRLSEEEMVHFMCQGFSHVVDATHPYAVVVSANLRTAAKRAGLPYLRLLRPAGCGQGCQMADTVAEACAMALPGNVLATTGSKEIRAYAAIPDFARRVYARVLPTEESVAACRAAGLPENHILTGRGPFSLAENVDLLLRYQIRSLITKDGGERGGFFEKLQAAKICGATPIVVRRPVEPDGYSLEQLLELLGREET